MIFGSRNRMEQTGKSMEINFNDVLYALSDALDYVEKEVIGVSRNHGKRVAYISVVIGRACGMNRRDLCDLAACAVLHDCALMEYMQTAGNHEVLAGSMDELMTGHCSMGEHNIRQLPFYGNVSGTVLYHHERADGMGPFGKFPHEVPLAARLIHFADTLDASCDFGSFQEEKEQKIRDFLRAGCGTVFEEEHVQLFDRTVSKTEFMTLAGTELDDRLRSEIPSHVLMHGEEELYAIARMFATIIDYKSGYTSRHSLGFAEKAIRMARHYGYDEEMQAKLYFAGALHDIGKLLIASDVLEKPGSLSDEEYEYIQSHVWHSYRILSGIRGMEDITRWASRHHEKLDGSGYPFGLKEEELSHTDRLMACIDIYQALVEERAYKRGIPHKQVITMLRSMASKGQLDGSIVDDLDLVFGCNKNEEDRERSGHATNAYIRM